MKAAALFLVALACTNVVDVYKGEGIVSVAFVIPDWEPDTMHVHDWQSGADFTMGQGDSVCVRFVHRYARSAKWNITTQDQPTRVLVWSTPNAYYPHRTVSSAGAGFESYAGRSVC